MHITTKEKLKAMHRDHELTRDVMEKGPYHVLKVAQYDMPWLFSLYNEVKPLPMFKEEFVIEQQNGDGGLIWVKYLKDEDAVQIDGFYGKADPRPTPKFSVIAKKRLFAGYDKVMFTAEPANPFLAEEAEMAFIYFVALTIYMNKYQNCCLTNVRKLKPAELKKIGVKSRQSALRTIYTVRRPIGLEHEKITINQKTYKLNNSRIKINSLKQATYFNAPVMWIDLEAGKWLSKLESTVSNEVANVQSKDGFWNWYKDLNPKVPYVKTVVYQQENETMQLQITRLDSGVFQVDKYNYDDKADTKCQMSIIVLVQNPEFCHFGILYLKPEYGYLNAAISKEAENLVAVFRQVLLYSRIVDFESYKPGSMIKVEPIWEVLGRKIFENGSSKAV